MTSTNDKMNELKALFNEEESDIEELEYLFKKGNISINMKKIVEQYRDVLFYLEEEFTKKGLNFLTDYGTIWYLIYIDYDYIMNEFYKEIKSFSLRKDDSRLTYISKTLKMQTFAQNFDKKYASRYNNFSLNKKESLDFLYYLLEHASLVSRMKSKDILKLVKEELAALRKYESIEYLDNIDMNNQKSDKKIFLKRK